MKKVIRNVSLILLSVVTLCLIALGVIYQTRPKYQVAFQNKAYVTYDDSKDIIAPENDGNNPIGVSQKAMDAADTSLKVNVSTEKHNIDAKLTAIQLSATTTDTTKAIRFTQASETVYATTNVNIRSSYSTKENNVVAVLKKGNSIKRIGLQEEWSKVLYNNKICYIKTGYLSLKKPVGSTTTRDFVSDLKVAAKTNQLIVVIGEGGSDSTVSYHIKDKNGIWHQQFSIDGDVGYKGITYNKKEGDKKTPAGLYSFSVAFGIKSDPGSKLTYRKVTKYDYWVDDLDSPYYNTWVNSKEIPGTYTSEHLIDHNPSYNYALNIDCNSDRIPGLGSAVFLHCKSGSGRTTGCVAISENYMKTLIQKVDSTTKILIVPDKADLEKY